MRILFVCKHNRFRSKVAETLFNLYNENQNVEAESTGVKLDFHPTADSVKKIMKEKGASILNDKPKMITEKLINESDRIVIVANNVPAESFPKEKTEIWEISDCPEDNIEKINRIIEEIEEKVKDLVEKLKNEKS